MIKMLKINLEYKKGILFVRLKGNLNANTASKFLEYTIPIIKDYKIKYLVYNLKELGCLDNYGEDALLDSGEEIKSNNGRVLIVNNNINTTLGFDKLSNELVALDLLTA